MLYNDSQIWIDFVDHVLYWEGPTSDDPADGAAKCAPGKIHTNKGITFCTWKSMAPSFGLDPSHAAFLKLTTKDAAKFLYKFYNNVRGPEFPDWLALFMTENAWGSGEGYYPWQHLWRALEKLGIKDPASKKIGSRKSGTKTIYWYLKESKDAAIQNVYKVNEKKLYEELLKIRRQFLFDIAIGRKKKYKDGWQNRLNSFNKKFSKLPEDKIAKPKTGGKKKNYLIFLLIILFGAYVINKKAN